MLVRHVAILLLPVMIFSLAAVLEQRQVLGWLLWAYPAGLAAAVLWTRAWYTSTNAAVLVREDAAAVLTFAELARGDRPIWHRVTDVRCDDRGCSVTIGRSPFMFSSADWDTLGQLSEALQSAHDRGRAGKSAGTTST